MRRCKKSVGIIISAMVALIFLVTPSHVAASPLFSLDTSADWNAALTENKIRPVIDPYPAASEHYGVLGEDYLYYAPDPLFGGDLFVMDSIPENPDAGLVMYWGNSEANNKELPQLAAWEYVYSEDPNLVGTLLNLTIMPPMGIWSVSLTLNDALGGWVSWDWNVNTPGNPFGPGPINPGAPYTITINPMVMGPQAGSTSFALNPVIGFDPTKAISIQADELAVGPAGFGGWAQFPAVPVVGGSQPWNYWSSMSVTPEPVSSALFIIGGAIFAGRRYWKKRRNSKYT